MSNPDNDGITLHSTSHPIPRGWARAYWAIRCWWSNLTWPIRRLWLTKTIEVECNHETDADLKINAGKQKLSVPDSLNEAALRLRKAELGQ